jgi:hypothetical protein
VLTRTYLRDVGYEGFADVYNRYLGWSLLRGDAQDWLKDLNAGRRTNVTALVLKYGQNWHRGAAARNTLDHIEGVLDAAQRDLEGLISPRQYPAWSAVLRCLSQV